MDQYVIHLDTHFLYWDLKRLYDLINKSDDDDLKDYLPYIQQKLDEAEN